jgi:hypothetical protein
MEEAGPRTPLSQQPWSSSGRRKLDVTDGIDAGEGEEEDGEDVEGEAEAMLSSISRMASEFPLWGGAEGLDKGVEGQAQEARRRVRALHASCPASASLLGRWELALSVILSDGIEVAELKSTRPNLWTRMLEMVNQPMGLEASDEAYLAAILSLADEVVEMNQGDRLETSHGV